MGLLSLLNRRQSVDVAFEQRGQAHVHVTTIAGVQYTPSTTITNNGSPKTLEEWHQSSGMFNKSRGKHPTESGSVPLKPRLVSISEGRPSTAPDKKSTNLRPQPKATGRNPKDSIRGLTLNLSTDPGERRRLDAEQSRKPSTPSLQPNSPYGSRDGSVSSMRRRSTAFVDILDAQGEIKPSDFRSRLQASGSRDYGEDVADRNMSESDRNSPSPGLQGIYPSLTGSGQSSRARGSVSAASYKNNHLTDSIPEQREDSGALEVESVVRPTSRQMSIRSSPRSKRRQNTLALSNFSRAMSFDVSALTELSDSTDSSTDDDVQAPLSKPRTSCGRISVTGSRASTPQRAPKTSDGPYMRDESQTLQPDGRSASPPGVPRYKSRQLSLPTDQLPSKPALGSVRSAREALIAAHAQRRGATPSPSRPLQPPFHREPFGHWNGFTKQGGAERAKPSTPTWEDTRTAASDNTRTFSFGSISANSRTRSDEVDKPPVPVPRRQASISSYSPSDHSSPRFTGSRSIRTADTSVDVPHTSIFREMKFGGVSSRSLRSRGGDSSIAPDYVGPDEESCGDSIFISPATPVKEQPSPNPLSVGHLDGGLSVGYESASIYDSDNDSYRERREQMRHDGEALLFRDKGFGGEGQALPGLFEESETIAGPRWPELSITPTDVSEMGDDDDSVKDSSRAKSRQNSARPFTQRERLLALGYDYDSDSDVEASVEDDELPEERALMLLNSLVESGRAGGQQLDMKTVAKLRNEIEKRKLYGSSSRSGSRMSSQEKDSEAETSVTN